MTTSTKDIQAEINGILWKACDTFRGAVDPSEYKNYILVMLFLKYVMPPVMVAPSSGGEVRFGKKLLATYPEEFSPGEYLVVQVTLL